MYSLITRCKSFSIIKKTVLQKPKKKCNFAGKLILVYNRSEYGKVTECIVL